MPADCGIFDEFHSLIVRCSDFAASRRFYEELLEFRPIFEVADMMVVYGTGSVTKLCLFVEWEGDGNVHGRQCGMHANFHVGDARAIHAKLSERGVECSGIDTGSPAPWFSFADPDGNRFDVVELPEDFAARG